MDGSPAKRIVGVSVRAGDGADVERGGAGVSLGRIITTNSQTERQYCSLPDYKDCTVVLMDPTMATGAAAMMAVRVLLDHGAAEEDIHIVTLITMHSVAHLLKSQKSAPWGDDTLDERFHLVPGDELWRPLLRHHDRARPDLDKPRW